MASADKEKEGTPTANTLQLLRERIESKPKWKSELYYVTNWDVTVEIRSLNVGARSRFHKLAKPNKDGVVGAALDETYFGLLRDTVFDPDSGKPLFREGDMAFLQGLDPEPVEDLVQKSMQVSGLTTKVAEDVGKVSEATSSST